ncbi:hypothetical protein OEZ86_012902 [Tetradesmus obliquus]|nr:hypothetical protein OEZ86_012902 [Tetradesmus obliquus]
MLAAVALLSSSPAAAQQPAGQARPPGQGGAAGAGPGACACPRDFSPVCGVDGAFFPNKCLAKCVGAKVSDKEPKDGKCGYIVNQAKQQQQQPQQQQQQQQQQQARPQQQGNKPQQQQQQQQKPPQQGGRPAAVASHCSCPQDVAIVCGRAAGKQQNYQSACYARCFQAQGMYQTVQNRCVANCWGASEHCHRTGWSGPCLAHLGRCHSHETGRSSLLGR